MSWQELLLPPLEFDFGPDAYPRNTPLTKQLQQMDRSQLVIDAMVDCALMIRKSTLPDTIVELLETFIAFLDEIETRYMFVTRVKQLLFNIITLWIQLWSVLIMGLMQSVIAYHRQAKPTRKRIGFQHTIEINVGGTLFVTEASLLVQYPQSYFGTRCGKHMLFVDRDPTHFRHILNHLRGSDTFLTLDRRDLQQLLHESVFYGLQTLTDKIKSKLLL